MTKVFVSLKDLKSGKFLEPQLVDSVESMKRTLSSVVNSPLEVGKDGIDPVTVRQFPSDFQLWSLGVFSYEQGILTLDAELVCDIASLLHT